MSITPLSELPPHHLVPRISEDYLNKEIGQIAQVINSKYSGRDISLVSIFEGGKWFGEILRRKIEVLANPPAHILTDHFRISSYDAGQTSNGHPKVVEGEGLTNPEITVKGKDVLLVEDIIDTGLSIARCAIPYVLQFEPASLQTVAMLTKFGNLLPHIDKRELRLLAHGPNISFFAVGANLDWGGNYRDLAGIYEVIKDN